MVRFWKTKQKILEDKQTELEDIFLKTFYTSNNKAFFFLYALLDER